MTPVIRPMETKDQDAVCRLLTRAFSSDRHAQTDWHDLLQWLYFSSHVANGGPRAFVIADGNEIVGHLGTTISELRYGSASFKVVQPVNWVAEPGRKIGLQSVELMRRVIATAEIALTIGGSADTRRLIPKLGFSNRLSIDRYIKVLRPMAFLRRSRSREQLLRNSGKLGVFLARTVFRRARVRRKRPDPRPRYHVLEAVRSWSTPDDFGVTPPARAGHQSALRNALSPKYLAWYRNCPEGRVHALSCVTGDGATIGSAMVIIKTCNRERYATLLSVDPCVDDEAGWMGLLEGVDTFLEDQRVTHINAIATYGAWRRALEHHGYCRLTRLPLWVYDGARRLAEVKEWHLTAMEGDLGYLLE